MKNRPPWVRTMLLFVSVLMAIALAFDVQDWREMMGLDIFSEELKREIFFDHLFQWVMWIFLIVSDLFGVVVWNWPKENVDFGSAVLLTAVLPVWAATALVPGFAASRPVMWWFLMVVLFAGTVHSWWQVYKNKKNRVSSS